MSPREVHTSAWIAFSYASFCTATTMAALGIVYLPLDLWRRGYLAVAPLSLVAEAAQ